MWTSAHSTETKGHTGSIGTLFDPIVKERRKPRGFRSRASGLEIVPYELLNRIVWLELKADFVVLRYFVAIVCNYFRENAMIATLFIVADWHLRCEGREKCDGIEGMKVARGPILAGLRCGRSVCGQTVCDSLPDFVKKNTNSGPGVR